jgi:hypothetical protein
MNHGLIALALLAIGIALPATAKQPQHHLSYVARTQAQAFPAKPITDRVPKSYIGRDGLLHDPDLDWQLRNEQLHGPFGGG